MIKRILCFIFGHDYDMTFPDHMNPLSWLLTCKDCGDKQTDLEIATRKQRKTQ